MRGGRRKFAAAGIESRPNGSDVKLQAAPTRERTSGAPLAAMHKQLTLSVCKRRDAVRLALTQPARPAGAAFCGLSASAASCAAPRQFVPFYASFSLGTLPTPTCCTWVGCVWQNRSAEVAAVPSCLFAECFRDACGARLQCACRPRPEAVKHSVLAGTAA